MTNAFGPYALIQNREVHGVEGRVRGTCEQCNQQQGFVIGCDGKQQSGSHKQAQRTEEHGHRADSIDQKPAGRLPNC